MRQKQLNASINTTGTTKVLDQAPNVPPPPPSKRISGYTIANFKKKDDKEKS